jgi:hypothetical protein
MFGGPGQGQRPGDHAGVPRDAAADGIGLDERRTVQLPGHVDPELRERGLLLRRRRGRPVGVPALDDLRRDPEGRLSERGALLIRQGPVDRLHIASDAVGTPATQDVRARAEADRRHRSTSSDIVEVSREGS